MTKVLALYPKQTQKRPSHVTIPKRFVYFWEINSFLSNHCDLNSIDAIDPEKTTFSLAKELIDNGYEVVVILCRIDNLNSSLNLAKFFKDINPNLKILFYGDIINLIPNFFKRFGFIDALVVNGDWEDSILSYIKFLENEEKPRGVYIKKLKRTFRGRWIGNKWHFPDIKKIPVNLYNILNEKKQLSFTVSRGCCYNCKFCLATKTFGEKDRRKSIKEILNYCELNKSYFDSFKFFSPTFTFNKKWVKALCKELIKKELKVKWASTSRIDCLDDEEMISLMAQSGCYKISTGIEIFGGERFLKRKEAANTKLIERVAKLFNKYKIILKALVMLGVPGQTVKSVKETFSFLEKNNILIRPTSYSPLEELVKDKNLTIEKIEKMDKLTFYKYGIRGLSKEYYFKLILFPKKYKEILNGL